MQKRGENIQLGNARFREKEEENGCESLRTGKELGMREELISIY